MVLLLSARLCGFFHEEDSHFVADDAKIYMPLAIGKGSIITYHLLPREEWKSKIILS